MMVVMEVVVVMVVVIVMVVTEVVTDNHAVVWFANPLLDHTCHTSLQRQIHQSNGLARCGARKTEILHLLGPHILVSKP